MAKIMFYDLETMGFNKTERWCSIIEIGAVIYDEDTKERLAEFSEFIKPTGKISKKIIELTGITNEMVANARSEKQVLMDFAEWIAINKPDKWAGHNIKNFDNGFAVARCALWDVDFKVNDNIVDTLSIARKTKPVTAGKTATGNPSYKLVYLTEAMGIEHEAHRAINDVYANIEVYEKMGLNPSKKARREGAGF